MQPITSVGYTAEVTITRPSNTTDYDPGDVVGVADSETAANAGSAIHELTNIGPAGGHIYLTDFDLYIYGGTALTSGTSYRVELYDASPTAILDNAAFNLVAGDRAKHLGTLSLATPTDKGDTLYSQNTDLDKKKIKLAAGSTSLFFQLVDVGGSTPTSGLQYKVRASAMGI